MYVLLLSVVLGGCPQAASAGQRDQTRQNLPVPLLPAEEAWAVTLPSAPSAAGVIDATRAYVPLQSGLLVALDRETGTTEWSIEFESSWAPVAGEAVVFVAGTGGLRAVRSANGSQIWAVPLDAPIMAPLTLQSGVLLTLVEPGEIRAFRATDGQETWRRSLGSRSGPVAWTADETSVCVSWGGRLFRVALSDGAIQWDRELSGVLSRPTIAGNRVFVGSTDNTFYALHMETGRLAWRWRSGGDVVGATVDDRFVYVASLDNLLRALHRGSGNQVWKRELSTRTVAPPSTFGGLVVVSGNEPALSTFNAVTGAPISTFSAPADLQGVPMVDPVLAPFRVTMIAVTRDGRAIGLRPSGMMFRERPLAPLDALPGRPLEREPRVGFR